MDNSAVVAVAVVAVFVVLVSLAAIDSRMLPASPWFRSGLTSLLCAATGSGAWLVLAPLVGVHATGDLFLPIAGLAGVAAFLATLPVRGVGTGILTTLIFGLAWSALVFVPTAIFALGTLGSAALGLAPMDHGGSLAVNVAGGSAVLGVLLANGSQAPRPRPATIRVGVGVIAVVCLSIGWIAWLATAELAFDEVAVQIVVNGVFGALGGIAGWLAVQRIQHQSTTLSAVSAGLLSGLVSITAGAPLFTPVSAAAAGILSGAAACVYTLRTVGSTRRQQWFIVGSHFVAGGTGLILLGLLATDVGFLFTGQIDFIEGQIGSTILVALYSMGMSFALWSVLRRLSAALALRGADASARSTS
jgi:ammonia channel protein AmtB